MTEQEKVEHLIEGFAKLDEKGKDGIEDLIKNLVNFQRAGLGTNGRPSVEFYRTGGLIADRAWSNHCL